MQITAQLNVKYIYFIQNLNKDPVDFRIKKIYANINFHRCVCILPICGICVYLPECFQQVEQNCLNSIEPSKAVSPENTGR